MEKSGAAASGHLTPFRLILHEIATNNTRPRKKPSDFHLVVVATYGHASAVAKIRRTPSEYEQLQTSIREFRASINSAAPMGPQDFVKIGSALFSLLIEGQVYDLFRSAAQHADSEPLILWIKVDAEKSPFLATFPWEFLYDSSNGMFLGLKKHKIARGLLGSKIRASSKPKQKIRALILLGEKPREYQRVEHQKRAFQESIECYFGDDDSVEWEVLNAIGPGDIERKLESQDFDVVHFHGHAGFDAEAKETYLSFERRNEPSYRCSAVTFATMLYNKRVRLAFLNGCESGKSTNDGDSRVAAMADALLSNDLPAVIANQFLVTPTTANLFASRVYGHLRLGKSVLDAVHASRAEPLIAPKQSRKGKPAQRGIPKWDWGIPSLHTSEVDLRLLDNTSAPAAAAADVKLHKRIVSAGAITVLAKNLDGGPSLFAPGTRRAPHRDRVRVSLADIDAEVAYLDKLADQANRVQSYFWFQATHLPTPAASTIYIDESQSRQTFVPRLNDIFRTLDDDLRVDVACCLTRHLVATADKRSLYANLFSAELPTNSAVSVVSTHKLRLYAAEAGIPYALAILKLCLPYVVGITSNSTINFHKRTCGCIFDYCQVRADIVQSLKSIRLDHKVCRNKLEKNPAELKSLDALLGIKWDESDER